MIQDECFKFKILETIESERDLGIIVLSNFNWKEQIYSASSKSKRVLWMLKRFIVRRDTDLWKKLYTSMIRPNLDKAVQVWNPRLIDNIERIEKVQRIATKTPTELSELNYYQRLAVLGQTSFKDRRVRGD